MFSYPFFLSDQLTQVLFFIHSTKFFYIHIALISLMISLLFHLLSVIRDHYYVVWIHLLFVTRRTVFHSLTATLYYEPFGSLFLFIVITCISETMFHCRTQWLFAQSISYLRQQCGLTHSLRKSAILIRVSAAIMIESTSQLGLIFVMTSHHLGVDNHVIVSSFVRLNFLCF